jgi:hypothetical protein
MLDFAAEAGVGPGLGADAAEDKIVHLFCEIVLDDAAEPLGFQLALFPCSEGKFAGKAEAPPSKTMEVGNKIRLNRKVRIGLGLEVITGDLGKCFQEILSFLTVQITVLEVFGGSGGENIARPAAGGLLIGFEPTKNIFRLTLIHLIVCDHTATQTDHLVHAPIGDALVKECPDDRLPVLVEPCHNTLLSALQTLHAVH